MEKHSVEQSFNEFGLHLFQVLAKDERHANRNLLLSPASISLLMSMAAVGASGDTQRELMKVLRLEGMGKEEEVHKRIGQLVNDVMRRGSQVKLHLAHSAWSTSGTELSREYTEMIRKIFKGDVSQLKNYDQIRKWVSDNTNGLIDRWYDQNPTGSIEDLTGHEGLLLLGAIYFGGKWQHAFDESHTEEGVWHGERCKCRVHLMRQRREDFRYYNEDRHFEILEVPFARESELSAIIVLPHDSVRLNEFIGRLDLNTMNKWRRALANHRGELVFPRMCLGHGPVSLKEPLMEMGIRNAFKGGFDKIGPKLHLSGVVHKAVIDIKEQGVEAAGAHGGGFVRATSGEQRGFEMKVDRPFLFMICDCRNDAILFMSRVESPHEHH